MSLPVLHPTHQSVMPVGSKELVLIISDVVRASSTDQRVSLFLPLEMGLIHVAGLLPDNEPLLTSSNIFWRMRREGEERDRKGARKERERERVSTV